MAPIPSHPIPSPSTPITISEKFGLPLPATNNSSTPNKRSSSRCPLSVTMRASLLTLFGLLYLGAALVSRAPCPHYDPSSSSSSSSSSSLTLSTPNVSSSTSSETTGFSSLLSAASPQRLHALLHFYLPDQYRHRVYESDLSAVEMLHKRDAVLANQLVQMAKRQSNRTSTTSAALASTRPAVLPTVTSSKAAATTTTGTKSSSTRATTTTTDTTPTTFTTATPSATTSESLTTFISTDSAGLVEVITSTALVVVRPSSSTSAAASTKSPDLQNTAVRPVAAGVLPAILAIVGLLAL